MSKFLTFLGLLIIISSQLQAQSKKELQTKTEELQKQNLKLEKENSALNAKLEAAQALTARLEKELTEAKAAAKQANEARLAAEQARNEAIKAKDEATKAQIAAMEAKEATLEDNRRMEEIFMQKSKGNTSLRKLKVIGRYYKEGSKTDYIELFENGTLYIRAMAKEGEKQLSDGLHGTYNLRGNKISLIADFLFMSKATDGELKGDKLIVKLGDEKETFIKE